MNKLGVKASRLKFFSLVLGGISLIVAHQLQSREIDEAVENALAKKERTAALLPSDDGE